VPNKASTDRKGEPNFGYISFDLSNAYISFNLPNAKEKPRDTARGCVVSRLAYAEPFCRQPAEERVVR
jgi:hypothetical protein